MTHFYVMPSFLIELINLGRLANVQERKVLIGKLGSLSDSVLDFKTVSALTPLSLSRRASETKVDVPVSKRKVEVPVAKEVDSVFVSSISTDQQLKDALNVILGGGAYSNFPAKKVLPAYEALSQRLGGGVSVYTIKSTLDYFDRRSVPVGNTNLLFSITPEEKARRIEEEASGSLSVAPTPGITSNEDDDVFGSASGEPDSEYTVDSDYLQKEFLRD